MTDLLVRTTGRAGHITLNRPKALNALTWEMCLAIEAALDKWRDDPAIALVMIDGAGERAFCAGGDIAEMYASGQRGDLDYGRRFWRDEYRLNAKLAAYPKPVVAFLHGFVMGGGVGVGCHASHRIVCDNTRIALPECGIGLVPDVGSTLLLARAPGHLGEYLGLTGARLDAGCAIHAGFADHAVDAAAWPGLKDALAATGDPATIPASAPPPCALTRDAAAIDAAFGQDDLPAIVAACQQKAPALAEAATLMAGNAPLAMACALRLIRAVRARPDIRTALDHEFRYTARAVAQGDFIEGIRAAIIDRDRKPRWRYATPDAVPQAEIARMTAELGDNALQWKEKP